MNTIEVEAQDVVGPEMAGTLMSPEEFDAHEEWDEGYVYELIQGVLVVSPPPSIKERDPNGELEYLLRLYREQHPQGAALDATVSEQYVRTHDSRRRADRVLWAGLGRVPDPSKDVPTIVFESVSAGKRNRLRDYIEKRAEYLALGVAEYWLFDRFRRILTVFRPGQEDLVIPHDGTYRTPLLPGFELPLARLLAAADRWGTAGR
jgi:Uma2 family endonuclease